MWNLNEVRLKFTLHSLSFHAKQSMPGNGFYYLINNVKRCFVFSTRIERIEFLDEVDLLHQLLSHYCIAWAVNDARHLGKEEIEIYLFNFTLPLLATTCRHM